MHIHSPRCLPIMQQSITPLPNTALFSQPGISLPKHSSILKMLTMSILSQMKSMRPIRSRKFWAASNACISAIGLLQREVLITLRYSDFMSQLQANYLPPNWEETVHSQILSMQMSKTDKFWDWCQNLRAMNIVLHGTNSHLSNFTLQNQLEASLEPSLCNYIFHEKLNKQTALKEWVLAVKEADEKLKDDCKCSREVFKEENRLLNPMRITLASNSHTGNTSTAKSTTADNSLTKKCPKLDPTECTFLQANDGCFRCQRFNQSQKSSTCPNGFPAVAGYKKVITTHDATGNAPKKTTPFLSNKGKSVAAILPEDTPMSSEEDNVVAAVMPSAVLGNGSFSEGNVSPTLCKKHLILKFQIAAQHLDFPLKFNAMLDNGAHVLLIHPDTVSELQLECFKLKKPKKVSIAISNKKKETMTLVDYVKFSMTFLDNAWTSKPIFAIIAPGLCLPSILGLPFLVKNNIIIDHADRTAVDKVSSYDLLNPP